MTYDALSIHAKIHCLEMYMKVICPCEYWNEMREITDVENEVCDLLYYAGDEYKVDEEGNWYWCDEAVGVSL